MYFNSFRTFALGLAAVSTASATMNSKNEFNRPQIHYSPGKGWMNDPNGPFYDAKEELWHLYFQYNKENVEGGNPISWGHATSKDLTVWEDEDIAIAPDHDTDGIFSGSVVVDQNNTSGLFNGSVHPDQRIVAIYTLDNPEEQAQHIAWSEDGGYTFQKYSENPVLSINNTQFRDPKVFWHAPSNQWIMVVVQSQHFKIRIYGSIDLKHWNHHSDFDGGLYGFQYECPGLIEVPVEGTNETKWVMFLAINPGMPLGGSANQYFIGDFDGFQFRPIDHQTRLHDFGKDFYAFQTFSDVPKEMGVLGIAWASNWQYGRKVPTYNWRSSQTLVRNYTIANVLVNPQSKQLMLRQVPILGDSITPHVLADEKNITLSPNNTVKATANSTGIFDFEVEFTVLPKTTKSIAHTTLEIAISSNKKDGKQDTIRAGYDLDGDGFYFDRRTSNSFTDNRFYTDKLSIYHDPLYKDETGNKVYKLRGIIDKNIAELYVNDGVATSTNTFFMGDGLAPKYVEVYSDAENLFNATVKITELSLKH